MEWLFFRVLAASVNDTTLFKEVNVSFEFGTKTIIEGGSGAMANCQTLELQLNKIGDVGMKAFAKALASGAMADQ